PASWVGQIARSADGRRIIFQAAAERQSLSRASFDPDRGLGDPIAIRSGALGVSDIAISPDDKTIVFSSKGGPGSEDIYTIDTDGGHLRQVTSDEYEDRGPSFSEDGKRILFYSNRRSGYGVWSINPDGSGLVELAGGSTDSDSDWFYPRPAPHHQMMVYGRQGLTFFDSSIPAKLLGRPTAAVPGVFPGAWSPDGTKLASSRLDDFSQTSPTRELVIYYPGTGTLDRFPHTGVPIDWVADGRRLLIHTDQLEIFDPLTRE